MRRSRPRARPRLLAERLERRMLLSISAVGGEILVPGFTSGAQSIPTIAMDGDGDFVIAWLSSFQDDPAGGISAQRFNASGAPQAGELHVNSYTTGVQGVPAVAMDADGDFVIAWSSAAQDGSGSGVYAQRYNAASAKQGGEFLVNTTTANSQNRPDVAMDVAGNFVVTWESNQDGPSPNDGIFGQRFNAAGARQGGEFHVNVFTTGHQQYSSVAMSATGDFVVSWHSPGQDGSGDGVYARRYNAAGAAQGGEFPVNTFTTGNQNVPSAAMDASGDFVIAWQGDAQDGSLAGVYAQRYNALGAVQGTEFRVNSFTTGDQYASSVAMDADGDFTITWTSGGQDGSSLGVYGKHYSAAGLVLDPEFRVNSTTANHQAASAVAMDAAGDFVATWQSFLQDGSDYGVYAQRYDESTDTAGPVVAGIVVEGRKMLPYGVVDGPVAQIVVSFSENVSDAGGPSGANSVTNLANWRVVHKLGTTVTNAPIGIISYFFNAATNHFQATLGLVGLYTSGNLQVVATDNVRDIAGNLLDGNLDGVPGRSASSAFGVTGITPRGPEFRANTAVQSAQSWPAVAVDPDGDFVVTWHGYTLDDEEVRGQRYNAAGVSQGGNFLIGSASQASLPAVAMDSDGDFVVVWSNYPAGRTDIWAQRYNASGTPVQSINVKTYDPLDVTNAVVAMDSDGDFVVVWQSTSEAGENTFGIYAQRYNSAGVAQGGAFHVNTMTLNAQTRPSVAMDADGDFVVTWQSELQDGNSHGIYAQRFNSAGVPQGGELPVNAFTTGSQFAPSVAIDNDGDFVISWASAGQDGSGAGVYAQRYNAAGVPQGGEFRANTTTGNSQTEPAVAMDPAGNFVVTWESNQDGPSPNDGIYGQRFNASGVPKGGEFHLNVYTTLNQRLPAIAMDDQGQFVVAWQSDGQDGSEYGVYARRYGLGATPLIGALADTPDPVTGGNSVTLTATDVSDDGSVTRIDFYRESNGIAGLQFGTTGDTNVGNDTNGGDGWAIAASTTGLANGTYTYYASALDNELLTGAPASTTNTVTGANPIPLAVNSSALEFLTRQAIAITFNNPLNPATVTASDLAALNLDNAQTPAANSVILSAGNTVATWVFNTAGNFISDGDYRFTLPAGAVADTNGNSLGTQHQLQGAGIFFFAGDANRDRQVNLSDYNTLSANYNQSPRIFNQGDFNYDTLVNIADYNILAARYNTVLGPDGLSGRPSPAGGIGRFSSQQIRTSEKDDRQLIVAI